MAAQPHAEKPFANEHSARLKSPDAFARIRQLWAHDGVRGIGGPLKSNPRGPSQEQAIRFKAAKWSVAEARKWLTEHEYKPISFEAATGEDSKLSELLVAAGYHAASKDVYEMPGAAAEVKELNSEEHTLIVTISTSAVDRHGDVLRPTGARLERFRRNPVVLYGHNYEALPVGKSLWEKAGRTGITAKPAFHHQTELSREVWGLIQRGVLNAWSVGFIPEDWRLRERDPDEDPNTEAGFEVVTWDLLEYSSVPVPSNFEALTHALKEARITAPALVKSLSAAGFQAPDLVDVPVKAQVKPDGEPAGRQRKESDMEPVTAEWLEANQPELVGELKAQGAEEEAAKAAAEAEKESAEKTEDAEQQKATAVKDAVEAERARYAALKEAFPERAEFVAEQFEKGASIEEARAAFRDVRLEELTKENDRLKKALPAGTEPIAFDGTPDEKDALELAKDYQAEHGGADKCSITEALRKTAPKRK